MGCAGSTMEERRNRHRQHWLSNFPDGLPSAEALYYNRKVTVDVFQKTQFGHIIGQDAVKFQFNSPILANSIEVNHMDE
jgi:hypothetical protein